jgi:hypothetical protein
VIPQVQIQSFSLGSLTLSGRTSGSPDWRGEARTAALRQGLLSSIYLRRASGLTAFANANRFWRVNTSGIFFMSIMTYRVSHDESFELGTNSQVQ